MLTDKIIISQHMRKLHTLLRLFSLLPLFSLLSALLVLSEINRQFSVPCFSTLVLFQRLSNVVGH